MIKNNRGISLVEILVSVSILGVLATIAVPSYQSYRQTAIKNVLKLELTNGAKAYAIYYKVVEENYCVDFEEVGFNPTFKPAEILSEGGFIGFNDHPGCTTSPGVINKKGSSTTAPEKCRLNSNSFFMGAKTEMGGLKVFYTMNEKLECNECDIADNDCSSTSCKACKET